MTTPAFEDHQAVHRYFSARCFNRTWELLEASGDAPSAAQIDAVVVTAQASLYHWMEREDCTEKHLSIGTWLLARVYAVVGRSEEARYWAGRSLEHAEAAGGEHFYVGYAQEAMARALLKSEPAVAREALTKAEASARLVENEDYRAQLEADLTELRGLAGEP